MARTSDAVLSSRTTKTQIHRLPLGFSRSYLIRQEGLILVDAGVPNKGEDFLRQIKRLSIEPQDISHILLTHGHWDHVGSAGEIRQLTGSKIAINHREKDWVEQALKPVPPGIGFWGRLIRDLALIPTFFVRFPGTTVDIVLADEEFPVHSWGINGKVLHTPGHSPGSMSLVLDTGEAFVGDLAMTGLPVGNKPGLPRYADDITAVPKSWRVLLDAGAKWIYPAHGKPFDARCLEKLL